MPYVLLCFFKNSFRIYEKLQKQNISHASDNYPGIRPDTTSVHPTPTVTVTGLLSLTVSL